MSTDTIEWDEIDEANYQRYLRKIAKVEKTATFVTPVSVKWSSAILTGEIQPERSKLGDEMYDAQTAWMM